MFRGDRQATNARLGRVWFVLLVLLVVLLSRDIHNGGEYKEETAVCQALIVGNLTG
jgi:hypothetical protein